MQVRKDIKEFLKSIPSGVTLVAATKYVDAFEMKKLYEAGIHNFGENRVESFLEKSDSLKNFDITWHFIGHLQRNKALKIIDKIDYLHSLDSLNLAKLIDEKRSTPLKVFVEVSINEEENKNGVKVSEIDSFFEEVLKYKNIEVVGLMMMSVNHSSSSSLNEQFSKLVSLRDKLEKKFDISLPYLSMGMSEDYLMALKNKTTHIRLGRILFSE